MERDARTYVYTQITTERIKSNSNQRELQTRRMGKRNRQASTYLRLLFLGVHLFLPICLRRTTGG